MNTPILTKTDLLLLGLLLDRPMHGYDLYQQIQSEGIDGWFHVSAAGVYYSLRKLRDQGLVTESRQRRGVSARKSTYHLTQQGRTLFFEVMETELGSQEVTCLDYDLVVYLLNRFPLQRAIPRLEQRHAFLAAEADMARKEMATRRVKGGSSLKLAILDHKRRFLEMEHEWVTDVLGSIQAESCQSLDGERQGPMIFGGDLGDFHLPDLIHLVVSGRHTGTLRVTDGAEERALVFDEGRPIGAAYIRQGEDKLQVPNCEQVLEGLCEMFGWQAGRFTFDQQIDLRQECIELQCCAEELILRGCRKVENWTIIQRLVPSADAIFEPGSVFGRLDDQSLTVTERQVTAAVDGVKSVAAIARELDLTLFETSRAVYCLTAIGVLRTANLDKIRLRRVFREIAELMCKSTLAWREPDDRTCEQEVNELCQHLPVRLSQGRIQDHTDPQVGTKELEQVYQGFLQAQFGVISRRYGGSNARRSFERTLSQLSPELQDVTRRHGFDRLQTI